MKTYTFTITVDEDQLETIYREGAACSANEGAALEHSQPCLKELD